MALLQTAKKTAEITEDTLTILRHSILFQNLPERDLPLLLQTLQARSESYRKGQFLLHAGDRTNAVGMVLKGHVSIIKDDFWGNENLLNRLGPGSIFAESFACAETVALNVSVTASSACEVLWLHIKELLHSTETSAVKDLFIRNFLQELAIKNLQFNEKMTHMGQRTIREKLLSFLSAAALKNKSSVFNLPLNRQQMADYLCVDRSALSVALGKLRDEGILTFEKNHFHLL